MNRKTALLVALALAALVLLGVFIIKIGLPNIVGSGMEASHKLAASTLRTVLWAEDQHIARTGRAGTLGELTSRTAAGEPPLLRAEMAPGLECGDAACFSGYAYRVYVGAAGSPAEAGRFLAYAWPVSPGKSGRRAFCLNEREDVFESELGDADPRYAGVERQPAWNACLPPGATMADRPVDGLGADGSPWRRWKGQMTRRAGAPEQATP